MNQIHLLIHPHQISRSSHHRSYRYVDINLQSLHWLYQIPRMAQNPYLNLNMLTLFHLFYQQGYTHHLT